MAFFSLRFYGRFVFAEPRTGGHIRALAIDPHTVEGLDSDEHHLFITVCRRNVSPAGTTMPPSFSLIAALAVAPHQLEQVAWNIAGHDVKVPGTKGVTWGGNRALLADLGELTAGVGRFNESPRLAKSVIDFAEGVVKPIQLERKQCDFVAIRSPREPAPSITPRELADVVEVHIEAGNCLRLELSARAGGKSSVIEIKAVTGDDLTIISFSHQCAAQHALPYDKEFAAFYEVLENPPLLPDRLVPLLPMALTEFPCITPGYIAYDLKPSGEAAEKASAE